MRSILIAVAATAVLAASGQAQERPAAGRAVPAGMAEQVGAGNRVAARGPKGGTRVRTSAAPGGRRTPAQRVKRPAGQS